jgi:hypothetical protein
MAETIRESGHIKKLSDDFLPRLFFRSNRASEPALDADQLRGHPVRLTPKDRRCFPYFHRLMQSPAGQRFVAHGFALERTRSADRALAAIPLSRRVR